MSVSFSQVALGAVEGTKSRRTGIDPVKGSVKLMGKKRGVLTKKTLVVLRTRPMMMAGPPFAAERRLLPTRHRYELLTNDL